MTRLDVRRPDNDVLRRRATRREPRTAILALVLALGGSSAAPAQLAEDLRISVAPSPATTEDPLVATVTGTASCPELQEPWISDDDKIVGVPFSNECLLLPPSPGPFTLFALIDPLDPGIWTINLVRVIDIPHNPDMVVDTVTVTVTDPAFSVELVPSPATEDDEVVAHLTGIAHDPVLVLPEIEPGRIRIVIGECPLCDPPSAPSTFQLQQPIGKLDAGEYLVELFYIEDRVAENVLQVLPGSPKCLPGRQTLCLGDGRFKVEATWTVPGGGSGPARAVEETADTGLFWFFSANNIELVVKVLDACDTEFESFWVFAGGLTDVGVTLEVTDTDTGDTVRYENPAGRRFETVTDTAAFDTCP